jgi:hypothetical protein
MKKIIKKVKKTLREAHKKGLLGKLLILVSTIALLATSVLPFII